MANKRLFPLFQIVDNEGNPLAGGKVFTYLSNTSTLATTYKNYSGSSEHENPIELDEYGMPEGGSVLIWLDPDVEYTFVIKTEDETTTIKTMDHLVGLFDPSVDVYTSGNVKFEDGTGILDSNANEVLIVDSVSSAVNYVEITNAATGDGPILEAAGSDTNIDLNLVAKGSGSVVANGIAINGAMLRNYIDGLGMTNNASDPNHDIDFAAGAAANSSNVTTIVNTGTITKRIDAAWSAGTGNGGLPNTVSYASNTVYHCFIIKDAGGTVDFGFDTSLTASNLITASSYLYYRRIGSVLTDGSSNIRQFIQYGDEFLWAVPITDFSTTLSTNNTFTLTLPINVRVLAKIAAKAVWTGSAPSNSNIAIFAPDQTVTADINNANLRISAQNSASDSFTSACQMSVLTNTSAQIKGNTSTTNAALSGYISTYGYTDFRGKV